MPEAERIADLNSFPKVTLLIVSFNRRAPLENVLDRFAAQNYPNTEIIVVDDGSTDGTLEMLRQRPDLKTLALRQNGGLVRARNIGQSIATGEFILNLDDDSWLESDGSLTEIIQRMIADPQIAVMALNVRDKTRGLTWPVEQTPFAVPFYTGCGNVYRTSALASVGDYVAEFHRQGEEVERSMRIYDRGFKIVGLPNITVFHDISQLNRDNRKTDELLIRNSFLREFINAPVFFLPFSLVRVLFSAHRTIGFVSSMKQMADICRSAELRKMLLRRRRPMGIARYIGWKRMTMSQSSFGR